MSKLSGKQIIFIGFLLVLTGVIIPFMMVMRWIEPNFPLSFISFACSISGMFLGLIGAAKIVKLK